MCFFSSIQKEERKIRMNINDVFQARKTKKSFSFWSKLYSLSLLIINNSNIISYASDNSKRSK